MNIQDILQDKKKLLFLGGLVLFVVIIIILLFSSGSNTPVQQGSGSVSQVVLAKGETKDKKPINPTDIFSINDPEIHAIASLNGIPPKSTILFQWYDLKTKKSIKDDPRGTGENAFTGLSSSSIVKQESGRDQFKWDLGDYEFRISINGKLIFKKPFRVQTDQQIEKDQILASIQDVVLTTAVDIEGIPTKTVSNIFSKDDGDIYASVVYNNLPKALAFEGRWFYVNEEKMITKFQKTISGTNSFAFSINAKNDSWLPTKKWPIGKYRLEIYVDTEQIQTIDFDVQ